MLPKHKVELGLRPDLTTGTVEVRFWQRGQLTGSTVVSGEALPIIRF